MYCAPVYENACIETDMSLHTVNDFMFVQHTHTFLLMHVLVNI